MSITVEHLRASRWLVACVAAAAATATAFVVLAPASPDLAAQVFRADLISDQGLVVWNGQWFAGHSTPGYSVVAPAVAAALGVWATGAFAIVASAALFERLVGDRFGTGGRVGALWFSVGAGSSVFSGRLTFALGVVVGLAALLAARSDGMRVPTAALGALTTLTSPVAGAFLALAGASQALVRRRAGGLILTVAPLASGLALALAFPETGTQPFGQPALTWILLVAAIALIGIPREHAVLRTGIALYAVAAVAAFAIGNPLGGNVARLGALFGGPIAACALWRRPVVLCLLLIPLLSWQWGRAVIDVRAASNDPSTEASYYTPLVKELRHQTSPVGRVEIPITHNHWEATYVADTIPMARGWERQLDRQVNGIFYRRPITAAGYHAWLDRLAVRWVAVPDARLEGASYPEAFLIRAGLPYLTPVWHNSHWQLFAVRHPTPLLRGPGRLTALTTDTFRLVADRPGRFRVRIHWQPYWAVARGFGCVLAAGDWTGVNAAAAGRIDVVTNFSLGRIGARSPRCRLRGRVAAAASVRP